jgi:pimeloyl-ACP methyl ester carboxylesterase
MQESFIATDHGRIFARDSGGAGPAVLFLHGNSSCSAIFQHQMGSDLAGRYRFIAVDLPGHGQSDNATDPARTYTLTGLADVVVQVLAALGIADPVIVGSSMGGHIAIEVASRLDGVRGLAISGTPPCGPGPDVMSVFTPQPQMAFTFKPEFTAEEAETYARYTTSLKLPLDPAFVAAARRADGRLRALIGQSFVAGTEGTPAVPFVAGWPKPIAVIQGADEPFFDNAYVEGLAWGNLWEGRVHIIPDAGHVPFYEKPEAYNPMLARFLAAT